ncbi:MAG: hypothetical protein R3E68_06510 [Burkholderiaceae bacterium]
MPASRMSPDRPMGLPTVFECLPVPALVLELDGSRLWPNQAFLRAMNHASGTPETSWQTLFGPESSAHPGRRALLRSAGGFGDDRRALLACSATGGWSPRPPAYPWCRTPVTGWPCWSLTIR